MVTKYTVKGQTLLTDARLLYSFINYMVQLLLLVVVVVCVCVGGGGGGVIFPQSNVPLGSRYY